MSPPVFSVGARKVWLSVLYEGPWDRLALWLLAIDPRTCEIRHEIRADGLRDRLAAWAERRDHAWRARHVERGTTPADRWKRRSWADVPTSDKDDS